ncbi:unnamed protein product [Chondrus crispus]|uniref:Uncharacterized protein n=1 Tax=Chondrus crispus TaxID=2769 RepID=R7QKA7_CHOCR|nr:unnamed protein product [Chondrus crispus]CDF37840.1 unnamed protein product [Chondrus crispus]|eukprot:XP_005717711.1 unnamed protein product [Chondrus crispus]
MRGRPSRREEPPLSSGFSLDIAAVLESCSHKRDWARGVRLGRFLQAGRCISSARLDVQPASKG